MGRQVCTPRAEEPDHPLPQGESGHEQFCWRQQGKMGVAGMSEAWGLIFLFWNALLLRWANNNIINNCIHFLAKFIKRNCIGCPWQGVGSNSRAAGVVSVRTGQGYPVLDMASSSWLQRTQLSPSAKVAAPLGKHVWERTENAGGQERVSNSRGNTKFREEGGERGALGFGAEMPLQPMEGAVRCFWRNCGPWRAHAGVGEKCKKEEETAGRNCYGLTDRNPHSPSLPRCLVGAEGRVRSEGLKLRLGKAWAVKMAVLIMLCLCFSVNLF